MRIDRLGLVRLVEQAKRIEDFEEALAAAARELPADPSSIVEFFEVPTGGAFDVKPEKAIDYFARKGLKPTFSYADLMGEAHDHAFTVAKMMDVDLLGQMRASLDSALANGTPFKEWADEIMPTLQKAGWWGVKDVVDPQTGQVVRARLGTPWRLETIFRTNMQTAYAAAAWQGILAQADVAPFLMYDAIDDDRTRPLHAKWDRTVLPITSHWWSTHYPPNGWNCRCGVVQLTQSDVDALGLKVAVDPPKDGSYDWTNPRTGEELTIPNGIDPGFWKNAGTSYKDTLNEALKEKVQNLPKSMRDAQAEVEAKAQAFTKEAQAAALQAQQALAQAQGEAALARAKAIAQEKAKQFAAQAQLDAIAQGKEAAGKGAKFKISALAQAKKAPDWPELTPTQKLDKVNAIADELKAKQVVSQNLSLYKKAILEGKTPPPAAVKTFAGLPEGDAAAFLKKVEAEKAAIEAAKAKAAAEAAAKAEPKLVASKGPNAATLTKIGEQKGSNPGGTYVDTETGANWYIKQPASADVARNEVLAAKLYELAGVDVPELHLVELDGKTSIASKIVDGLTKGAASDLAKAAGTADGFAVDAWLANWDVVGLGYDNLLMRGARAFRVDTGGALRYRAQGGLKGAAFGDRVTEIESLRDASLNRQAEAVFGRLTAGQIEESVVRVLKVGDDEIRKTVALFGPTDAGERDALIARLIARKKDLAQRYPGAAARAKSEAVKVDEAPKTTARVTQAEQDEIERSRVNGYGFATDSDQIEDNMVLVHAYRDKAGADVTRGFFKLRPEAGAKLAASIAKSAGGVSTVRLAEARQAILAAVKSINFRAANGSPLDATVVSKIEAAIKASDTAIEQLNDASALVDNLDGLLDAFDELSAWRRTLAEVLPDAKDGKAAFTLPKLFNTSAIPDSFSYKLKVAEGEAPGVEWKRVDGTYEFETARFDRSFANLDGGKASVSGTAVRYEARLADGTRVVYFPHGEGNAWAMQGVVKIDTAGKSADASTRIFSAIDEIGITSTRASELDRQHLYLNAFARLALLRGPGAAFRAEFEAITDKTAEAIGRKLALLKKATGVDVEASEGWKTVDGVRQAFGHGRAYQYRPDLTVGELDELGKDLVVYHNPQGLGADAGSDVFDRLKAVIDGGGVFASLTDRVRRGVRLAGSSVSSDLSSGGGDYHFTRIKRRQYQDGTGVYWKARVLRRMDAITYDSDQFGRTTAGHIEANRLGQKVEDFRRVTNSSGNETIFKGGLSIFDDLDRIVLSSETEVKQAIAWMRDRGYSTWPDGRKLEEVIITKAKHRAKP